MIAIVLAVNAAGVWGIAAAQRGLHEQAERGLQLETEARARDVESVLASATADLAFLVGSTAPRLAVHADRDWRDAVGGSLLLILRGHPEVASLAVLDASSTPQLEAGRPRGVPGFWVPGSNAPETALGATPMRRGFDIAVVVPASGQPARLEASIDPEILLEQGGGSEAAHVSCSFLDAEGSPIASENRRAAYDSAPAEALVDAAGWADGPGGWRLSCLPLDEPVSAALAPVVARYRLTIVLNLVVMALAAVLGFFAFHQARRRQQLEAQAREEARVRELERQLFHAERLSTVGRLAAGMAHEINNPLEGIANYLHLAESALERREVATVEARLAGVRQGLERAAGIVRRVLDHANPSAAPLQDVVDLAGVMRESLEFVRAREEFSAIRFEAELSPADTSVRGSGVMLGQVFLNLLLNACEAQPGGGEVRMSCRRNGGLVEAEVADRGPGVPHELKGRIFEPFETTKVSAGLGLSICHSIVRQHDGELTLEDRAGGGSIFRVRLKRLEPIEQVSP